MAGEHQPDRLARRGECRVIEGILGKHRRIARANLNASAAEIEAVIAIYQIAYATVVITGGRLGDIAGRKPVFILGLLGFTATSLLCGRAVGWSVYASGSACSARRTAENA